VAEGIETEARSAQSNEIGCDQAQGYLFSRPIDPQSAEALLIRYSVDLKSHFAEPAPERGIPDGMEALPALS